MNDLFLKIINMSISASWLVLAVLLLRFVLKKAPKWVNVLLWGIVAVRLAFPFSIESALSLIPSAETVPMDIEMAVQPTINSGVPVINSMVNPMLSSFAPPQDVLTSANPLQIWIPIFSILWIAGIAALLLYTVVSYWHLRRKVSEAVILRDNIFQSENVASPFVLGVFRPKIYLPYNMGGQDLNHVVAHEQAHIRRRDHWWKPLGFLLLTIHWFNPLMWLAYVLLCRDIELACDEKVIKVLGNEQRADYTQALVACSVNRRVIAACPLAFGEVGVKERVKSVMNYKKPAFWIIVLAVIACVVVAVCFLTDPEQDSYTLRIVVPAGSQDDFVYSDEEVSTTGNSIVIILPFAVEVVARHAVDNVAVDPPSQKLQRARHEVRQFKHLVIIDQQRGVRRQNGGRQQADVAHVGVAKHGQELDSPIVQSGFSQDFSYLTQISRSEQVCLRIQLRPAHDTEHLPVGFLLHLRRGGADQDHQLEVLFMELLHAEQGAFQRPLLIHRRGMVIDRVPLPPQLAGSAAPVGGNDHGFSHTVSLLLRVLGKHGCIDILQLCHKELLCEVLAGIPGDKRPPLRGFSAVSQFL